MGNDCSSAGPTTPMLEAPSCQSNGEREIIGVEYTGSEELAESGTGMPGGCWLLAPFSEEEGPLRSSCSSRFRRRAGGAFKVAVDVLQSRRFLEKAGSSEIIGTERGGWGKSDN